jgi:hypothetical protein
MAKETFYEAVDSNRYKKEDIGKLVFKREEGGPQYKVVPGDKYSDPRDSIENDDFTLRMIIPANHNITDPQRKKVILEQLFHNGKKI